MNTRLTYTFLVVALLGGNTYAQQAGGTSYKPRVINTTDLGADPDDEQSMVRQLVCANEFDIEGLIVSTGCWKKNQSNTKMLDKLVEAYGECYDNLKVHAEGFPTVEYLRSISVMGQKGYGMSDVGIRKDHGPLCEIYPHEGMGCTGVCEGDSPAFLWLVSANRGLNDPNDPTQESWGGQFKKDGNKNHYIDGPGRGTISKWRAEYQKEFAERSDWCVK